MDVEAELKKILSRDALEVDSSPELKSFHGLLTGEVAPGSISG